MPEENAQQTAPPPNQWPAETERRPFERYAQELKEATERALSRMQGKDQGLER